MASVKYGTLYCRIYDSLNVTPSQASRYNTMLHGMCWAAFVVRRSNAFMLGRYFTSQAEGMVHAAVLLTSAEDNKPDRRIEVVQNDLTKENVDVIINAANSWLKHGGGVAGAVAKAGGNQIQIESDEYVTKNGPVKTGDIAVTGPGNLPCKILIHAVGPVWEGGQKDEDDSLHSALYKSLTECHSRRLTSVAVPAISSGIFGFPKRRCARVLFSAALEFFRVEPKSTVDLIRFTNFDKATVDIFKEVAAHLDQQSDVTVQLMDT